MAIPQWSDLFSLDHPQVDAEHQRMMELLRWLEAELYLDRDMDAVNVHSLVRELNAHVEEHFTHEEAMMDGLSAMPSHEKAAHRADHERWKLRIKEHLPYLLRSATDLERRAHLARILMVGKAFWAEHFAIFDRKVGEYLRVNS